jgi:CO dehydrogenase maturation factor
MIVATSGKGGVGKTSLAALILDELARYDYHGRILAVDGDPAMTLHLALGIDEPGATVGAVRDSVKLDGRTLRSLPAGTSPGQHLLGQLRRQNVVSRHRLRGLSFDFLAMGPGEGPGCYCSVNGALKQALAAITGNYDVVILDNEAGLEHISRYRLAKVDLFLVVAGPDRASHDVAARIIETAGQMTIEIGQTWVVYNRVLARDWRDAPPHRLDGHQRLTVPHTWAAAPLEMHDRLPIVRLGPNDPVRAALYPVVEQILSCV